MEFNQQALQRGLQEDRLNQERLVEVDNTMKKYTSIPIKRLRRLVQRYFHHVRMKEIGNIKNILLHHQDFSNSTGVYGNFIFCHNMSYLSILGIIGIVTKKFD